MIIFGHPVGDALLVEFALMLKELLRETDIVARIGGGGVCNPFDRY